MAVLKHIASKNADYGEAIKYLLYQHDEFTQKPILGEQGRLQLREEFYMDGILCDPMDFDHECEKTNAYFSKNQKFDEVKSHHYIISFDPRDKTENGLTGPQAQALCLDFAKKYFPGHQALVVTHTDGHNGTGNIHTHIVINSLRKENVPEQDFMERPADHKAGYKHHQTKALLEYLDQAVMDMCEKNGLHQIDLLSPSGSRITQKEYWAQRKGQQHLKKENEEITAAGLKPKNTTFQTQKQFIRDAVDDIADTATDFEEFRLQLLERYRIEVIDKRGRYSYHLPDREKNISERSLGTHFGREYLTSKFEGNRKPAISQEVDYHADPMLIFYFRSELRLVVNLQACVKAQQSEAYAQAVKVSNLQQMAETLIYVQNHGYDTQEMLNKDLTDASDKLTDARSALSGTKEEIRKTNEEIHYYGQYLANKSTYKRMLSAKNKKTFREDHPEEITAYEEARHFLKELHPDDAFTSMKELRARKQELLRLQKQQYQQVRSYRNLEKELQTVEANVSAILDNEPQIAEDRETVHEQRKENTL